MKILHRKQPGDNTITTNSELNPAGLYSYLEYDARFMLNKFNIEDPPFDERTQSHVYKIDFEGPKITEFRFYTDYDEQRNRVALSAASLLRKSYLGEVQEYYHVSRAGGIILATSLERETNELIRINSKKAIDRITSSMFDYYAGKIIHTPRH